jgi:CheY-like chemotaxis protein
VYSGERALEALDGFQPDMLISDVIMTGMTGIEAAIQTRAKLPGCKILLFSGQAATADLLERARAQGHEFEILAKPVHPTDLLAKLRA